MTDTAFDFALPETRRRTEKPRSSGQTMMMDIGMPLGAQQDWLDVIGPFFDMAKLVTGTASLYHADYLKRKLDLYAKYEIKPFIGGGFLERIFDRNGLDGVRQLYDECLRLGIAAIEVSETILPIDLKDRLILIERAIDAGLEVHAEVGTKIEDPSSISKLTDEVGILLEAGAHNITVEGAELMSNGVANQELCDKIAEAFDLDSILFELCGPWLPRTHSWETYSVMRFLVATFGPNVNIGNATPELVVEIETQRRGLNE